jgi:CheY-like chemotaxis protein
MNLFNSFDHHQSTVVGFGMRALLISSDVQQASYQDKLARLGCAVESFSDVYTALDRVVDGPDEIELILIDCDSCGGQALGQRAHALLKASGRCIPVILVSAETREQSFPASRYEPTLLRAPVSSVALRVGFEHALQERLLFARAS